MDRVAGLRNLLESSQFFKLVCGAGNENADEVNKLAFIYTLAGCNGFDVSASPEIVKACLDGIEAAMSFEQIYWSDKSQIPYITVSVGMPGDHHVRKAVITDNCIRCDLCIPSCPTNAITPSLLVKDDLCIGCGDCEAVCPPTASAIKYKHNEKELSNILPECIAEGAESIELHAGVPDNQTTIQEWKTVCDCLPDGMVSMCLDRYHLSNVQLIERIRQAKDVAGDRLIIQADGVPISGGKDNFNTTLQAVSIADVINKDLKLKDKRFRKLPVLISGGTNTYTGKLAKQCGVPFSGITIGTHARKLVKEKVDSIIVGKNSPELAVAINSAHNLISSNIS